MARRSTITRKRIIHDALLVSAILVDPLLKERNRFISPVTALEPHGIRQSVVFVLDAKCALVAHTTGRETVDDDSFARSGDDIELRH